MNNILQAMKDALGSLGRFTGEEGSTEDDFRIMDNLIVAIEEMEKAEPVAWDIRWKDDDSRNAVKNVPQCAGDQYAVPLYLHPAPAIPEGWQLVPIESTKKMSDAFWSAYIPENKTAGAQSSSFEDWWDFIHMYKAMLAAAPEVKS